MQPSPFPTGAKVAAYLRDSGGDDQDQSIDQQERVVRKWCNDNDLLLTKLFIDTAISGLTSLKRTAFLEMITYFRQKDKPPETGIVIWDFSRFARNINDAQFYKADLRRMGYKVFSLTDNIPEGIDGILFESLIDWKNTRDMGELSVKIRRAQVDIFLEYGALGGVPPKGFKREEFTIGTRRNGKPHIVSRWVPDPDTWETVKKAWLLRASGYSYRKINEITRLFKTNNSYSTMFKNRLYLGEMSVGENTVPDYCEPMITQETWDVVQALNKAMANQAYLKDPYNQPGRKNSSYMLTGLIYCAVCGAPLNGRTVQFKDDPVVYHYYHCSAANRSHTCDQKKIPAGMVEEHVMTVIRGILLKPEMIERLQFEDRKSYDGETEGWRVERAALVTQLGGIRKKQSNLTKAIAEYGHSRAMLRSMQELDGDEAALIGQISELDAKLKNPPQSFLREKIDLIIAENLKVLDSQEPVRINQILRGYIKRVIVERVGRIVKCYIEFYPPPDDPTFNRNDPTGGKKSLLMPARQTGAGAPQ